MRGLGDIKERMAAITPGPWELAGGNEWLSPLGIDVGSEDESSRPTLAYRDANFIAHAPEDMGKVVAALEAVKQLAEEAMSEPSYLLPGGYPSKPVEARLLLTVIAEALA